MPDLSSVIRPPICFPYFLLFFLSSLSLHPARPSVFLKPYPLRFEISKFQHLAVNHEDYWHWQGRLVLKRDCLHRSIAKRSTTIQYDVVP
ncbi:hypothetical protein F5051DRAFT_412828 [Lentinula edodes]|nr:hypothetical protein F5051DRAFT_412828 [Lentinula edodes]